MDIKIFFLKCLAILMPLIASNAYPDVSLQKDGETNQFLFNDWDGMAIKVFYALPDSINNLAADTPVLFVMTGRKRNADVYRNQWEALAKKYGFIVLAPEFKWQDYPDEVSYDMGNVFTFKERLSIPDIKSIKRNREGAWVFSAIEPLFDFAVEKFSLQAQEYSMYGHSSGAGFVHRYLFYKPKARLNSAVAANGAWYLLPVSHYDYPYGLKGSRITKQMLKQAFKRDLTIMFAQKDLGPRKQYHANTPQAKAQGPHVVSRAMNFFLMSTLASEQLGDSINWKIESVPHVGHSNKSMAPYAVRNLFPKKFKEYIAEASLIGAAND